MFLLNQLCYYRFNQTKDCSDLIVDLLPTRLDG